MSSISEANGLRPPPQQLRSSPQGALQRPLSKPDPPTLDLLLAPPHCSLAQYLADIPPPLRPQKSVNSFGNNREGGDSRDVAHQQSHSEQILPLATVADSSTSSDSKWSDSKPLETVYQQGLDPDWNLPPPTFLEPKTYRASTSDAMFPRPKLEDLQPHAASDPSVESTRIQQLESEIEDSAWLPIQKPEAESSLKNGPNSSECHSKDHEYSVPNPSTALPTPKRSFPSPTSKTCPDDEYLAYHSGTTSLKASPVSPRSTLYEKRCNASCYVSSSCTRDKLYNMPYKPLGAIANEANAPQFRQKQSEEKKTFPATSSGSSTAKNLSRVKPQEGQRPMSTLDGAGNTYENLSNLAPNCRATDFTNSFTDPGSEFPTSCPIIPAKAKQLLGIHPKARSSATKNLPLGPKANLESHFFPSYPSEKLVITRC